MMNNLSQYLIILLIILLYIIYKYITKNNGYWKLRGIPEVKGAIPIFGHIKDVILMKKNMGPFLEDIDKEHRDKSMIGIYEFSQPVLIVRDLNLIKFILQSGFNSFSEHPTLDEILDPLFSKDPFFENNQKWKESRGFFTNAFSGKKIKELVPVIIDVTKKFINYMNTKIINDNKSNDIEVKNLYSKFTAAVSGSTILGIDAETFVDNDSPNSLRSMMDGIFLPKSLSIRQILVFFAPSIGKLFGIGFVPNWINKGFQQIVDNIVLNRKNNLIPRNDILQLIVDNLIEKNKSDKLAAAHAFGFFVEIYETSSIALSTMTYFLAKYPEIQDKARSEIIEIINKHNGELTYEAINDMIYLEQIVKEALRIVPPGGRLIKNCTEPVTLEGSDGLVCHLNIGDQVVIPVYALHKNPEHWENPDNFYPERFDKSQDKKHKRYTFLPFGEGPRMCPGMRFAIIQMKIVMANVLLNYIFESSNKMLEPIQMDPKHFLSTIKGGYWIKMQRFNNNNNNNN